MEPFDTQGVIPHMRHRAAPVFVALVVAFVAAGAVVRAQRQRARLVTDVKQGADLSELTGYWVWSRVETRGEVTRRVEERDLHARVGPDGWEGCPEGYLCTRYGVRTLAFGPRGAFHYVTNVFTSSDFQYHGSISDGDIRLSEFYSCAHPQQRRRLQLSATLRWRLRGEELHVAINPHVIGGSWPFASEATGTVWVFRSVSRSEYYENLLIRSCQPTGEHSCAAGCFSRDLVD